MTLPENLSSELHHYLFATDFTEKRKKEVRITPEELRILDIWFMTRDGHDWIQENGYLSKKMIRSIAACPDADMKLSEKLTHIFIEKFTTDHTKICMDLFLCSTSTPVPFSLDTLDKALRQGKKCYEMLLFLEQNVKSAILLRTKNPNRRKRTILDLAIEHQIPSLFFKIYSQIPEKDIPPHNCSKVQIQELLQKPLEIILSKQRRRDHLLLEYWFETTQEDILFKKLLAIVPNQVIPNLLPELEHLLLPHLFGKGLMRYSTDTIIYLAKNYPHLLKHEDREGNTIFHLVPTFLLDKKIRDLCLENGELKPLLTKKNKWNEDPIYLLHQNYFNSETVVNKLTDFPPSESFIKFLIDLKKITFANKLFLEINYLECQSQAKAEDVDLEFLEITADLFPKDFDKMLFKENNKNVRPIDRWENETFIRQIVRLRKNIFLEKDESGNTFFHKNIKSALGCPWFFNKPKTKQILLDCIATQASLLEQLLRMCPSITIVKFPFMEKEILAIFLSEIKKDPINPLLLPAIVKHFLKIASDKTLLSFVACLLDNEHFPLLKELIGDNNNFDQVFGKYNFNKKLCHIFLKNNSLHLLNKDKIVKVLYVVLLENPKEIYSEDLLSNYLKYLKLYELHLLTQNAIVFDNPNLLRAIILACDSSIRLLHNELFYNGFVKVFDKELVAKLLNNYQRLSHKKEAALRIIRFAPKIVIEEIGRQKFFESSDEKTATLDDSFYFSNETAKIEMLNLLNIFPREFREVLCSKSSTGFLSLTNYEQFLTLLAKYAPNVWKAMDSSKRTFLHDLVLLDGRYHEYAITIKKINNLKNLLDEAGRTSSQLYFENFPLEVQTSDRNLARRGYLFQNCINQKSFLHSYHIKNMAHFNEILKFLLKENLVDQVVQLEDSKKRKPYFNIVSQLDLGSNPNEISFVLSTLKICDFLKMDDPQNVDLIYESIISEKKSQGHIEFLFAHTHKENFKEALERMIANKTFPFSMNTSNLLYEIIKKEFPDQFLRLLQTIPNIKKGQAKELFELLFQNARNRIPELVSVIGTTTLRDIIQKDSYSFYKKYILFHRIEGLDENNCIIPSKTWDEYNAFRVLINDIFPNFCIFVTNDDDLDLLLLKNLSKTTDPILLYYPHIKKMHENYLQKAGDRHKLDQTYDLGSQLPFLDYLLDNLDEFCRQENPLKAALFLANRKLMEEVIRKIGFEAAAHSLVNIKKWYPLPLPSAEPIFYEYDPLHLKIESIDPALLKGIEEIKIDELLTLFDQINFTDRNNINYFDPNKLKIDLMTGYDPLTVEKARKYLARLIEYIHKKEPITGTPTKGTELLNTYYAQLSSLIKQIIHQIKEQEKACMDGSMPERREVAIARNDAILTMAIAGKHCGGRWIGDAVLVLELLKNEHLDLEKLLLRIQANHRLSIAESLAFESEYKGNVHALNSILVLLGPEFKIPGYEHIIEQLPVEFDIFQLREDFLKLYNAETIVDNILAKVNEKEMYKNLVLQWFKQNPGDYKRQEYAKKLADLKNDLTWQDIVRKQSGGQLTEEQKNVTAFLDYANNLEEQTLKDFIAEVEANSEEVNLLVPLIKQSIIVPNHIEKVHEKMDYTRKIILQVLEEADMLFTYLKAYQNEGLQENIKNGWIKSKDGGMDALLAELKNYFTQKDLIIENETIKMLMKEEDPEKRVGAFKKKIEELVERQRNDDYLNEVLIEVGINNNDEAIYDYHRVKIVEMLVHFKILRPKTENLLK